MATIYGLTSTGFVPKTVTVVRADLDAAMRAAFGASMVLSDGSVGGQVDGIMAERYAELWALAQAVYSSQDPDAAVGQALDALCKLTGTFRPPATYSIVTETLTGTPTLVPAGSIVATASTSVQFKTTVDATMVALTAWAATHGYTAGDRVTNNSNAYQCITTGTSAGSGGPTTTDADITDGGAHWTFLGAGTAAVDVIMTSVDAGDITAFARDLTNVNISPTAGLTGAINLLDAVVGRLAATDQELRLLRESELGGEGSSTADAILAALLKVSGVTTASVNHNDSDVTDSNGLPPHSVEALVQGGADADIAAVLFANVAAGIVTYTATANSVTVVDSQGVSHVINFSRPVSVPIYVDVTLTYDVTAYPTDGDSEVQQAIALLVYPTGLDVRAAKLSAAIYAAVPGILDVTPLYIGTAPSPGTSTTIPIDIRHLAVYDSSRVTVHSSAATP